MRLRACVVWWYTYYSDYNRNANNRSIHDVTVLLDRTRVNGYESMWENGYIPCCHCTGWGTGHSFQINLISISNSKLRHKRPQIENLLIYRVLKNVWKLAFHRTKHRDSIFPLVCDYIKKWIKTQFPFKHLQLITLDGCSSPMAAID